MNIAEKIDHTILRADAREEEVKRYCREAVQYHFASVCVNTCHVPLVAELLKGSGVKVCCVVGFPLGAMSTRAKAYEAQAAVEDGAEEVDMVVNIGAVKDGNYDRVEEDIRAVVAASGGAVVKVILETCRRSVKAGAGFVKTSTGFSTGGATEEAVRLMRETVGDSAKVKASGGIRTCEQAKAMIEAGADRIGAGNGVILLEE
mgnify:CR=1 FL=1